jgi:hypothetical protein
VVGSNYSDEKAILKDAFGRMVSVVEQDHVITESDERSPVLVGVNVVVRSPDDEVLRPMGHQDSLLILCCAFRFCSLAFCTTTSGWMNHTVCLCLQLDIRCMPKFRSTMPVLLTKHWKVDIRC